MLRRVQKSSTDDIAMRHIAEGVPLTDHQDQVNEGGREGGKEEVGYIIDSAFNKERKKQC